MVFKSTRLVSHHQLTKPGGNMKKLILTGSTFVGLFIAVSIHSQLPPQSTCGADDEPNWDPKCVSSSIGNCEVYRICQGNHIKYGERKTYCCYENDMGRCVQIWGQWECCSTNGGTWKKICRQVSESASQVCMGNGICTEP
jgi:hypothetical protein